MPSSFPGSLDTLATNKQDDTDAAAGTDLGLSTSVGDHAQHHNDMADAINKIEAAVGANTASFIFTSVTKQAADLTNATTTPSNTDLVFSFAASGIYAVDLYLMGTSGTAGTGYGFALDTSVAITAVALHFTHQLANTGTLTGGSSIADATNTGLSSAVPTASALTAIMGSAILVAAGSSGTATLTFRPEAATSATFKANSVMRVQRVV